MMKRFAVKSFGVKRFGPAPAGGPLPNQLQAELTDVQKKFKEQSKREQSTYLDAFDSEFWAAICFQTREQKEAFILGVAGHLDEDKYIDGVAFAKALGIALPPAPKQLNPRVNAKFAALALEK